MTSNKDYNNEHGFVSIIAATTIMILVSLVVLGFSVLMQRENRQSLDRQLSTQAFYAAETGVNDVYQILRDAPDSIPLEKNDCDVSGPWNDGIISGTGDNAASVSYSCLRYDRTPIDLIFTDTLTATSGSKIFPIESVNPGEGVNDVTFSWNGSGGTASYDATSATCNSSLPRTFAPNTVPLLRVDIIEAPTGGFTRQTLIDRTSSMYLYPRNNACGSSSINFDNYIVGGVPGTGQVVNAACNAAGCEITIDLPGENRYFARVKSIYQDVGTLNVVATGTNPAAGDFQFKDAQTIVDSTGKANDVLRRIEVRISNQPQYNFPEGVIESSEGFCKLLSIVPDPGLPVVNNANCY